MKTELILQIDGQAVSVSWEDNASAAALKKLAAQAPIIIQTSAYGGFEQAGPIGTSLPRNDRQITTKPGDIVLYAGSQIVVFYGSNSWAYTRLGRITDQDAQGMKELLGHGDVEIRLDME